MVFLNLSRSVVVGAVSCYAFVVNVSEQVDNFSPLILKLLKPTPVSSLKVLMPCIVSQQHRIQLPFSTSIISAILTCVVENIQVVNVLFSSLVIHDNPKFEFLRTKFPIFPHLRQRTRRFSIGHNSCKIVEHIERSSLKEKLGPEELDSYVGKTSQRMGINSSRHSFFVVGHIIMFISTENT